MPYGDGAEWQGGNATTSGTIYFDVEFDNSSAQTGAVAVSIANGDTLAEISQKLADAWNASEPVADTWAVSDDKIVAFHSKDGLEVTVMGVAPAHQGRVELVASGSAVEVLNQANSPAVANVLTKIVVPA